MTVLLLYFFFFSSRRRHTRFKCDWSRRVLFRSEWKHYHDAFAGSGRSNFCRRVSHVPRGRNQKKETRAIFVAQLVQGAQPWKRFRQNVLSGRQRLVLGPKVLREIIGVG